MTLMDTILRRKPVEPVEPTTMISKAVHERLMSSMGATIERLSNERNGLLRDKLAADEKLKEMAGIERYAASLKPDALKYRERCKRDREAAAAKRKAKGGEG